MIKCNLNYLKKNHIRGIKNLYVISNISFILFDILKNIYTSVIDIKKYLFKYFNNIKNNYFFILINTLKNIYHGKWYLIIKLKKELYKIILHNICIDAKLNFKNYNITNYSIKSINIYNLIEFDIIFNE